MLNPVFSIKHMRHITPLFYEVVKRVRFIMNLALPDANKLDAIACARVRLLPVICDSSVSSFVRSIKTEDI